MKRSVALAGPLAGALVLLLAVIGPAGARAEPLRLAGAGTIQYLAHEGGGGAGGGLDLWAPFGAVRIGGFVGVGVLAGQDDLSRVYLPIGPSLAVELDAGALYASLRLRAGVWGGATDDGLAVGGIFGAGAHFGYALGPDVHITVGVDGWFMVGQAARWVVAPGLGIEWSPESPDAPPAREPVTPAGVGI